MLDIPGYKIEHELGRGGMAKVYLAVQESVQRRVALKVMSPVLLVDPSFSARFMREARIAANLSHQHVVAVYNVGAHEDSHYIAMEYVSGGDLAARCLTPMLALEALRVIREIAGALDYAHSKGFVHRDVKPENILFRENGSTVLTDFGIARAVNSNTQMTRTGAVIGTPQYMSPEQARGRDLDGRSDLYGLGIVLYEMLTGKVPYEGSDSVSVGIKHVTEPLPQLPVALSQFQPLLDRFLAKDPKDRYQTGDEAVLDVQRMEQALASDQPATIKLSAAPGLNTTFTDPPTVQMPTPVPPSDEKLTKAGVSPTPHPDGTLRQEPTLGRIDDLSSFDRTLRHPSQLGQAQTAAPAKTGGGGKWLVAMLMVVAIAAGAGWWQRDQLLALLPDQNVANLLVRAEAASELGQMYGTSDRDASQLFKAVLVIDPDNARALRGLEEVAAYLMQESAAARLGGDPRQASIFWDQARQIKPELPASAPSADGAAAELTEPLALDQQADPETNPEPDIDIDPDAATITALLADAIRLIVEERLFEPAHDNALSKLQAVLAIDPENQAARDGLGQIANRIVSEIDQTLADGELVLAAQHIEQLAMVVENSTQLAAYQDQLRQTQAAVLLAAKRRQDQIDDHIGRAAAALAADRLALPQDDSAVFWNRKVLDLDPANETARKGLSTVARRYLALTEQALEDDRLEVAAGYISQIRAIDPGLGVAKLNKRLALYQQQRERNRISAQQVQEIEGLLAEAQSALDQGDLVSPPGSSAYDRFKDVLRMDPQQQEALQGLGRLSARLAEKSRQAMLEGAYQGAAEYLGDAQQIDPQNSLVLTLVSELASSVRSKVLEAIADQRLADAESLLQIARSLEPNHPQMSRLQLQLSVAKG